MGSRVSIEEMTKIVSAVFEKWKAGKSAAVTPSRAAVQKTQKVDDAPPATSSDEYLRQAQAKRTEADAMSARAAREGRHDLQAVSDQMRSTATALEAKASRRRALDMAEESARAAKG